MPSDSDSLSEKISSSIQQLSAAAQDLNSASDELGKAIAAIDSALQGLNVGVPTWICIEEGNDLPESEHYWTRNLGYEKVNNRWGLALSLVSGRYDMAGDDTRDVWLFNESPRWLRLKGVGKIPDLLDAMIKAAAKTAQEVRDKTAEANSLAKVIAQAVGKKPSQVPVSPEKKAEAKKRIKADAVLNPMGAMAEAVKFAMAPSAMEVMAEAARKAALPTEVIAEAARRAALVMTPTEMMADAAKKLAQGGK